MRCEVIAVGTELLLGQIIDTNSAWIGEQLALAGIDCHFQSKVGDNLGRMVSAIRLALDRNDAVILCGGLGPTQDDITREALVQVMGAELVRDDAIAQRIRERFRRRGREMPAINLRQADVPRGASVIPQQPGTAPGLVCPVGEKVIYAVPGVPHEMRAMLSGTVIADLRRRSGVPAVIMSRTLRTWGRSESGLSELLAGRMAALDRVGNPTLAFLASGIEGLKVRITAKAADERAAELILAEEEGRLRELLGDIVFGADTQTMESVVLEMLRRTGLTLAVAEPLTGGLMATRITSAPAANEVFRGALVTRASDLAADLLGLSEASLVSEPVAKAMALGAARFLRADIGLAATGVAGPAGEEGQAPGSVFLGLAMNGKGQAQYVRLPGDPDRVRQFSVISLLNMLRLRLLAQYPGCIPPPPDRSGHNESLLS